MLLGSHDARALSSKPSKFYFEKSLGSVKLKNSVRSLLSPYETQGRDWFLGKRIMRTCYKEFR